MARRFGCVSVLLAAQLASFLALAFSFGSPQFAIVASVVGIVPGWIVGENGFRRGLLPLAACGLVVATLTYAISLFAGFSPMYPSLTFALAGVLAGLAGGATGSALNVQPATWTRPLAATWLFVAVLAVSWTLAGRIRVQRLPTGDDLVLVRIEVEGPSVRYVFGQHETVRADYDLDEDGTPDCREDVFKRANGMRLQVLERDDYGWFPVEDMQDCKTRQAANLPHTRRVAPVFQRE